MKSSFLRALAAAWLLFTAGCVVFHLKVKPVSPKESVTVNTPVKAHLKDGTTVVFRKGIRVEQGFLRGRGAHYDLSLSDSKEVEQVALESVVGVESFHSKLNIGSTVALNLAGVGAVVGGAVLALILFGSCPTVYSDDGKTEESELFSSSIAPLFEARDVDRLHAQADSNGVLRLRIRNEALETHYINHLQLFESEHSGDEFVLPDGNGRPIAVRGVQTPEDIVGRNGLNLHSTLSESGGGFYKTDQSRIDAATKEDYTDWIDLTAPITPGATSVALVFRMRNSLLSTTMLYDMMLAPSGARALDWLGSSLSQIGTAVELGRWHQRMAGLHVMVWEGGTFREVVRISDSGPIMWKDIAAEVPVQKGAQTVKIRLSFLADQWRFDRIGVAASHRLPRTQTIDLSHVTEVDGQQHSKAANGLMKPDDQYLQTGPGDSFDAHFAVGVKEQPRTFLLSSQGYYTEWIRGSWIQNASTREPFLPTDESAVAVLRQWSAKRVSFENQFMTYRVSAR